MKILLVYPQYPDTFWGFKHALKFVSKKASVPPLSLLTVAAMLPKEWDKKLVDMNVTNLTDDQIKWSDYVFISAMAVQAKSVQEVIARCKQLNVKTVAGGPLFTSSREEFDNVNHLVLNEAEVTLPLFLADLEKGSVKHLYSSEERPNISKSITPMWSLIDMKKYFSMNIQYSRGCPFNCEFCDIIALNGNIPRTKEKEQVIAELEALYQLGWRKSVFIVDDNFIGNKRKLKEELLPAVIKWMEHKKHPFTLLTEASINLADDEELLQMMVAAGFDKVFIGIETPNEESLVECSKSQNTKRDLVASVKVIQNHGIEVMGGFIVGFDSDPLSIFKNQINFIQKSGIVTAMVGLLNAPPGTRLHRRLSSENRLLKGFVGNNTDGSMNFIPKMDHGVLIEGHKEIVTTIYSNKNYYERIRAFLREYKPRKNVFGKIEFQDIQALFKSIWVLGIKEKGKRQYWRLFISTLVKHPRKMPISISLAIYGYHFRKITEAYISG
jgi:radical SAM superfamily enzyme YgiQ (UPF0313 family)